jgi:hypothetical protein
MYIRWGKSWSAVRAHIYKNLKLKVMKCTANIYFNQQCLTKNIIPNYANISIPLISPAAINTQKKAQIQHIKGEIKFLYKKRRQLNFELYQAHLKVAHEWNGTWHIINEHIQSTINSESTRKYQTIGGELDKLTRLQTRTPSSNVNFCPRVSGFGGLMVSMLASGTQDHGFKPSRSRRIFWAKKFSACLPSEGK